MIQQTGKVGRYFDTQFYFKQAIINWDYYAIPTYTTYFNIDYCNKDTNHKSTYYTTHTGTITACSCISVIRKFTEDLYRLNKMYVEASVDITSLPSALRRFHIQYVELDDERVDVNETITTDKVYDWEFTLNTKFNEWLTIVQNEHLSGSARECILPLGNYIEYYNHVVAPDPTQRHQEYKGVVNSTVNNIRWQKTLGTAHQVYNVNTNSASNYTDYITKTTLVHTKSVYLHNIKLKSEEYTVNIVTQSYSRFNGNYFSYFVQSTLPTG